MKKQKEELLTGNKQPRLNLLAVFGFACGCITLLVGIFSIPAIILSVIGWVQASKKNERGKGFAIAGMILGATYPVLLLIYVLMGVVS